MLSIIVLTSITLCFIFFCWRKWKFYNFYHTYSISGPAPHFLFGNLIEAKAKNSKNYFSENTRRFGSVWAFFLAGNGQLVISDPDLLQEIFIKKFSNFRARRLSPFAQNETQKNMFAMHGNDWKRLRTLSNPAFTELKMKSMFPLIDKCTDRLMHAIQQKIDAGEKQIDISDPFQEMALDVFCNCAFGIETGAQNKNSQSQIQLLTDLKDHLSNFNITNNKNPLVFMLLFFPEFSNFILPIINLLNFNPLKNSGVKRLYSHVESVLNIRKNLTDPPQDLLQFMLDAKIDDESVKTTKKQMSIEEIINQSRLFLIAGYETTSSLLTFISHSFASFPKNQIKIQKEIDHYWPELSELKANNKWSEFSTLLSTMPYLNATIEEALRFFPFTNPVLNRVCTSSTVLSNGMKIDEGLTIQADAWSLHFNPNLWPNFDPNSFEPERFIEIDEQGNKMFAKPKNLIFSMTFGAGPRLCIGKKMAVIELRSTLTKFVRHFNVKEFSDEQKAIPIRFGTAFFDRDPILIDLETRNFAN